METTAIVLLRNGFIKITKVVFCLGIDPYETHPRGFVWELFSTRPTDIVVFRNCFV